MRPRVTLVVPAGDDVAAVRVTLESVVRQDRKDWEVVVVRTGGPPPSALPDGQGSPGTAGPTTRDGALAHPRVRWETLPGTDGRDGDLAPLLEHGRRRARGELVGVLAPGDQLEPGALTAALTVVDGAGGHDAVYTDEQWPAPGAEGIATKPDWSPSYLRSYPYVGRLCLVRALVLDAAGGFREGLPGAEEWDAMLRVAEVAASIGHAPVVGVSRPGPPREDAQAWESGRRAVGDALERAGRPGVVDAGPVPMGVRAWWPVPDPAPLVSIVVPTAGGLRTVRGEESLLVERCLRSVLERTTYDAWEVVLVTSAHTPVDVVPGLERLLGDRLRTVGVDGPFNFSYSVNEGARVARGDLLLLLNDDTEVVEPRWLERMVSLAHAPDAGVVGAKLRFEEDTVQHVGVIFDDGWSPIHALGSEVLDSGRFGSKVLDLDYPAVTGACLLTPANVFREVGGFCTDLPLNFNDLDYCFKVAATGRTVATAGFAELYHYESSTRGHATEPAEFAFLDRHWGVRRHLDQHVHYRAVL